MLSTSADLAFWGVGSVGSATVLRRHGEHGGVMTEGKCAFIVEGTGQGGSAATRSMVRLSGRIKTSPRCDASVRSEASCKVEMLGWRSRVTFPEPMTVEGKLTDARSARARKR